MTGNLEFNSKRYARFVHTSTKKLGSMVSRHQVSLLVLLVSCAVGAVGIYVIRDLQAANR